MNIDDLGENLEDKKTNFNEINIIKENPIISVLTKEALLYQIGIFLRFEERETLYSINKKTNEIFRNSIKEIKSKHLLKHPELLKRFSKLKKFEICNTHRVDLDILKHEEFKGLEALKIKEVIVTDEIINIISQFTELNKLILITNHIINI